MLLKSKLFKKSCVHLHSTLLPQVTGRQLADRAGARHGNLTPPRISPSCPHCLRLWLGRSIIIRLLTVSLQYSLPVLLYGRMGTALHLSWPSLITKSEFAAISCRYRWFWRILQCRCKLPLRSFPSADVSRCRIFCFLGTRGRRKGPPHYLSGFVRGSTKNIFTFRVIFLA